VFYTFTEYSVVTINQELIQMRTRHRQSVSSDD